MRAMGEGARMRGIGEGVRASWSARKATRWWRWLQHRSRVALRGCDSLARLPPAVLFGVSVFLLLFLASYWVDYYFPPDSDTPYILLRVIGSGDKGTVYLARTKAEGIAENVALKVLKDGVYKADLVALHELGIHSQLDTPPDVPIVRLLSSGTCTHGKWLAFEYMSLGSADRMLRKLIRDVRLAKAALLNVLKALEFCATKRILHRDVKWSNVLFTPQRNDMEARLADFGSAVQLDSIRPYSENGTWFFQVWKEIPNTHAPFHRPEKRYNTDPLRYPVWAFDMWGVGVMLLELAAGVSTTREADPRFVDALGDSAHPLTVRLVRWGGHAARDLLLNIFREDPAERISPVEAAQHPFFSDGSSDVVPASGASTLFQILSAELRAEHATCDGHMNLLQCFPPRPSTAERAQAAAVAASHCHACRTRVAVAAKSACTSAAAAAFCSRHAAALLPSHGDTAACTHLHAFVCKTMMPLETA